MKVNRSDPEGADALQRGVWYVVPPNKALVPTVRLCRAAPGTAPRGTAPRRSAGGRRAEGARPEAPTCKESRTGTGSVGGARGRQRPTRALTRVRVLAPSSP